MKKLLTKYKRYDTIKTVQRNNKKRNGGKYERNKMERINKERK